MVGTVGLEGYLCSGWMLVILDNNRLEPALRRHWFEGSSDDIQGVGEVAPVGIRISPDGHHNQQIDSGPLGIPNYCWMDPHKARSWGIRSSR